MRLLIVGTFRGELVTAARMAREKGADVAQVDAIANALAHLRAWVGINLVFGMVVIAIAGFG